MKLNLIILKDKYSIYKFDSGADIPEWLKNSDFYSVTGTKNELSVVCKQNDHGGQETKVNKDWRVLKIKGELELSLIGIIAEISGTLAEMKIPVFVISTYNTDYILVKNMDLDKAIDSLKANGIEITFEQ